MKYYIKNNFNKHLSLDEHPIIQEDITKRLHKSGPFIQTFSFENTRFMIDILHDDKTTL